MVEIMFGLFGWGWKVKKLRKKWDRLREKALGKPEPLRATVLQKLDAVQTNLTTLEEQQLGMFDRGRIAKDVEVELAGIHELLKMKKQEMETQQK